MVQGLHPTVFERVQSYWGTSKEDMYPCKFSEFVSEMQLIFGKFIKDWDRAARGEDAVTIFKIGVKPKSTLRLSQTKPTTPTTRVITCPRQKPETPEKRTRKQSAYSAGVFTANTAGTSKPPNDILRQQKSQKQSTRKEKRRRKFRWVFLHTLR